MNQIDANGEQVSLDVLDFPWHRLDSEFVSLSKPFVLGLIIIGVTILPQ